MTINLLPRQQGMLQEKHHSRGCSLSPPDPELGSLLCRCQPHHDSEECILLHPHCLLPFQALLRCSHLHELQVKKDCALHTEEDACSPGLSRPTALRHSLGARCGSRGAAEVWAVQARGSVHRRLWSLRVMVPDSGRKAVLRYRLISQQGPAHLSQKRGDNTRREVSWAELKKH